MTPTVRVRRPLAVLVSRFPQITETFILREIIELERQGQPVVLVPMIREDPPVVHEEAMPWIPRAIFTPFFSLTLLSALARATARQPAAMLRVLGWIASGAFLHPATLLKSLSVLPKCAYLADRLRNEGVTHLHAHFATHPTTMARVISMLSGIPFSFTVHAHDIFVDRSLLREKIRDARFIRAISHFNKRFLESLYGSAASDKTVVIHVGIEPDRYEAARPEQRGNTPRRLITVAALKPYKGLLNLVSACRLLSDEGMEFRCDIIGQGPMRNVIRRAIVKAGLHGQVHLRGALPQDAVAEEIRQAEVFVLPSVVAPDGQMEGIPVALMEAMAAGLPTIATALSGIPELVEQQKTGLLVDPANPRHLADAIRSLLKDPALGERLSVAGREKVRREFDLRVCVSELLRVLDAQREDTVDAAGPFLEELSRDFGPLGIRRLHRGRDSIAYELRCAHHSPPEIVVKRHLARPGESRHPEERAGDEWHLLQALGTHFKDSSDGVPAAVRADLRSATLAMSRVDGVPMTDLLRSARDDGDSVNQLRDAARGAGAWLHRFQEFQHGDGAAALDAVAKEALRNAKTIGAAPALTRRISFLRGQLSARPLVAVSHHGDYWPGNIYASGRSVQVIDLEGYGLSLRSHDVTYFLLHVSLYLAFRGQQLMDLVRESFFEEYAHPLDPSELELCRLATALQLASRDFRDAAAGARFARWKVLRKELAR